MEVYILQYYNPIFGIVKILGAYNHRDDAVEARAPLLTELYKDKDEANSYIEIVEKEIVDGRS